MGQFGAMRAVDGGQRTRLPVSLRIGLLACLPSFHTTTRMPPDDAVQQARLPLIHTPARAPPGLRAQRTARMRPVNSRLLARYTGRVVARILFFYLDD